MNFNEFQKISTGFLVVIFLLAIGYWLLAIPVDAQSKPEFLVSWQAQDYAPNWYQGKILPVHGTPVGVSFELIDNGKIADLSKTTIRWYVNDNLVINENNGLGIKNLKINLPDYNGGQTEIRIVVLNYLPSGMIDKLIYIPAAGPQTVIDSPYYNGEVKVGASTFNLYPFFFSVSDLNNLSVNWLLNNQAATANGSSYIFNLNIGAETPSGTQIDFSAQIKNQIKDTEFASENLNLIVK